MEKEIGWYKESSNQFFCNDCFQAETKRDGYAPIKEGNLEEDIYTCDKCGKEVVKDISQQTDGKPKDKPLPRMVAASIPFLLAFIFYFYRGEYENIFYSIITLFAVEFLFFLRFSKKLAIIIAILSGPMVYLYLGRYKKFVIFVIIASLIEISVYFLTWKMLSSFPSLLLFLFILSQYFIPFIIWIFPVTEAIFFKQRN